jgi:hypothetical protein
MAARTKETSKDSAPIDIDALVDERISLNRDEIRQQVIQDALTELLRSQTAGLTLEEFVSLIKNSNKELWKYASQRPVRIVAAEISGADKLREENLRLKEQLRGGAVEAPRRGRRPAVNGGGEELKTKILDYLKGKKDKLTVGQLVKGLGVDTTTIKKPLAQLRKEGRIAAEGARRSMRYSLPS